MPRDRRRTLIAVLPADPSRYHRRHRTARRGFAVRAVSLLSTALLSTAVLVLSACVAFLLLIAVSNALNLLLSLSLARGREFAVRAALGASRWRLARQQLVEHLVLVASAWSLGLVLGKLAIGALLVLAAQSLPRGGEIALTDGVVIGSALLCLLLAVLLTAAGQIGARGRAPAATLRDGGRGQSSSRAALRTQSGLLIAQTALTTTLLVAAVLVGLALLR